MMTMKSFLFLIIPAFLISTDLSSQSVQEIIAATQKAYAAHENLSMNVTVLNYASKNSSTGQLVGKGRMSKSKTGYYSQFMNTELISNKECTVIIDHDSKEMTLMSAQKKDLKKMDFVSSIDSLSKTNDSVAYKGIINGEKCLIFFGGDSYVIRTEVFISASTSLIDKIIYYYAPETEEESVDAYKTEIVYQNISFSAIDETVFSEQKFIEFKNNHWSPVAAYKNYHVSVVEKPKP